MAVRIDQNDILVPGQATLQAAPQFAQSAVPNQYAGTLKAFVRLLNLMAGAPVDLAPIFIPSTKYVPIRDLVYNPTADLSAATLGLYTAAAAGGTNIIAPVLLASLTGVGTYQELSIAALSSVITAATLIPRLTVDSANPGTVSLVIEFMELGLI